MTCVFCYNFNHCVLSTLLFRKLIYSTQEDAKRDDEYLLILSYSNFFEYEIQNYQATLVVIRSHVTVALGGLSLSTENFIIYPETTTIRIIMSSNINTKSELSERNLQTIYYHDLLHFKLLLPY